MCAMSCGSSAATRPGPVPSRVRWPTPSSVGTSERRARADVTRRAADHEPVSPAWADPAAARLAPHGQVAPVERQRDRRALTRVELDLAEGLEHLWRLPGAGREA